VVTIAQTGKRPAKKSAKEDALQGLERRRAVRPCGATRLELTGSTGVIMLGLAPWGRDLRRPADWREAPQAVYVAVDDVDAHYERARSADAEITRELENTDYGSREYSARDLEGQHWHFGAYRTSAAAS
jgi:uncharacterized glyoxalase superfamily protein PhnB